MLTTGDTGDAFHLEQASVRRGPLLLLDAVTCDIPRGACTAVVGRSGAGKSTLLRLLNRLEEPTEGTVTFRGTPLHEIDVLTLRRRVGLVGQHPVLLTDHVLDDLRVGHPGLHPDQAAALLDRVGLPHQMLQHPTSGLSGGEAQRVCLARALAVDPEVLLLDEPTASLDAASVTAVEAAIRDLVAEGGTVALVSHDTRQARRVAEHALVLDHGRLVDTGPSTAVHYLTEQP